jgi:hypothetical protein
MTPHAPHCSKPAACLTDASAQVLGFIGSGANGAPLHLPLHHSMLYAS